MVENGPADKAEETPRQSRASVAYVYYVIILLSLVNIFNYMDRAALSILLPSIKGDLELSDTQIGLLVGFAFSLFYALCGIPIARWADRGTRRNIIALSLAVWSVMTIFTGAAQNFWQILVARMGLGASEAGAVPASQSLLCDYVPIKDRPGAFAVHSTGLILGSVIGLSLTGWVSSLVGWRWTFALLGAPGIAVALLVRLTLKEPIRGALDGAESNATPMPLPVALLSLWRNTTYRMLVAYGLVNGFIQSGIGGWGPSFYARSFGVDLTTIGVALGIATGATGISLLLGGYFANVFARRGVGLPILLSALLTLLMIPVTIGQLFSPTFFISVTMMALASFLFGAAQAPIAATLFSVVAPSTRATAGSVGTFIATACGASAGPLLVGALSDALQPAFETEALRYAMLLSVIGMPFASLFLYLASRTLTRNAIGSGSEISPSPRPPP